MGFLDFLFGTKPASNTNQAPTMTPEQQAMLQQLLSGLSGSPNANTPYAGQLSANPNSGQLSSLAALEQMTMNNANPTGVDMGSINHARGTLNEMQDGSATDTSDMFRDSVENPAIRSFREQILPDITRRFGGNAAFGSDRIAAEGKATSDLTSNLASARSKMVFDSSEASKNRALSAAGQVPGLESTVAGINRSGQQDAFSRVLQLFGANSAMQTNQQDALTRQYQEAIRSGDSGRALRIQQQLAALGAKPFENITTTTPGTSGAFGPMLQAFAGSAAGSSAIAGGGSALAGGIARMWPMLLSFFSSKEFKTDKKPVDHSKTLDALDELEIAHWKYKDGIADGGEHIGPYAEDFHELFMTGSRNKKMIPVVDALGVTMSAVKGLNAKVRALEAKM